MWNKTQIQKITVPSDNWFQVSLEVPVLGPSDALASDQYPAVEATYYSALWVLLIHALGSYICYITGMFSVIRYVQNCLQQNPKRLQLFPFQQVCHLTKNYTWAQLATIVNFLSGNYWFKIWQQNRLFLRLFPNFPQSFKANQGTLHKINAKSASFSKSFPKTPISSSNDPMLYNPGFLTTPLDYKVR